MIKETSLSTREENERFWKQFFGNLFRKQITQKEIDEIVEKAISKSWKKEFMRR